MAELSLEVFRHVVRYKGFVYMSDSPLAKRPDAEQVLRASRIGDRPAFDAALFAGDGIAARLVHEPLQSAQDFLAGSEQRGSAAIITDMNLLPEFVHGVRMISSMPSFQSAASTPVISTTKPTRYMPAHFMTACLSKPDTFSWTADRVLT